MSEGAAAQEVQNLIARSRGDGAGGTSAQTGAAVPDGLATRKAGRRREDRIIAVSVPAQRAIERAMLAAREPQPVIIRGPAGSGKSMLARAIHTWSANAAGPFETLAADAVPEPLQARELFGCAAGTYPALPDAFVGALERAAGGTLLLDRIDALSPVLRATLGQVLLDGKFQPEGEREGRALRARLIATCERDLADGPLGAPHRQVELPPLAERREDILPLAAHFLSLAASEAGVVPVGFTPEARAALLAEPWPGQVSELRERVRQAVRLAGSGAIPAEALLLATASGQLPSFREAKRAFEARYVQAVLRLCDGNISQAARLARKDRKDFYDVIRRTGVDPADFRR